MIQKDKTGALTTSNMPTLFQPTVYGISSYDSNAMKSKNPHSGIYEAKTSRTLDQNGGNPACNQGGIAVIEGNGSRPSHKGDGYKESDVMYTLNATEQHGVSYQHCDYIVRRLTPLECERLQGFPDGWTLEGEDGIISDTQRYRALGNSVALPCVEFVISKIVKELEMNE